MIDTLIDRVRPARTGLLAEPVLVDLGRTRVAGPPLEDLARHRARLGPRPAGDSDLLAAVQAAQLTGHGGAHVPAVRKWRAVAAGGGARMVVANAVESEPLSGKDFALLTGRPHLVLDGLVMLAELLGAGAGTVWVHAGPTARAVTEALAERADPLPVRVVEAPPGYLSGQSSAVVRGLSGGPALPTAGRDARGPLVHNAETLARVALLGRGLDPGGPLVTVLEPEGLRVHPTTAGARPADLIPGAPQAVLVGGYGGRWHRWDEVAGRPLTDLAGDGLRGLGAGVLAPVGPDACGVRETAAVLGFLAASSARQCGPCTSGLPELAAALARLAAGARRSGRDPLRELAGLVDEVEGRGACRLPDGATGLLGSALRTFADDVRRHARRTPCPPGRAALPVPAAVAAR